MAHMYIFLTITIPGNQVHSQLGYYFWDKGIEDYVALDLSVYYDLLLFDQYI
jgi:hypothetical protein